MVRSHPGSPDNEINGLACTRLEEHPMRSHPDKNGLMWCDLDDLRLWYEIRGTGTPIVFLHGWTMDHRDELFEYEPIFAERPGWLRLYPDLPGMGKTASRDWIDSQDRYLEIVLRFLDHVLHGQRFVLAGTSAGAYLARGVVHRRAQLIDGLLLKVPMIVPNAARREVPRFQPLITDEKIMAALSAAEREELKEALVQSPDYLEAFKRKLRSQVQPAQQIADNPRLEAIRRDPDKYTFSFDVDSTEPFKAPALIISGRQDTIVGYRDAWKILDNFPRATFAVIDRADHGLPIDQPKLFHALVNEWLDRVEEARNQT
jgi:pimeloyl-ACP methyl ester carboxylesterase